MDNEKINMYLMTNGEYFPPESIPYIRQKLETLEESRMNYLYAVDLKDPKIYLLISIFLGGWGVDRFLLGDIGMGVLKLLTGGVCGILWIIDIINISKTVKEDNLNKIMQVINFY